MTGRNPPHSGNAGLSDRFTELSYYDFALFAVPVPLLVGLLAGQFLRIPSQAGLLAGAALSALVVTHVLFFVPPTRRGSGGRDGRRDSEKSRRPPTGRSA
ncbi:hypothetical protein [Halorussus amylolyticus]|uniref:hypothetical protein n=1 Tax=Halorussus amylolyticus TaxID=1126242 RepID=UPI00138F11FA|nr:hypothetical protein [Halorussus amylolyticus]